MTNKKKDVVDKSADPAIDYKNVDALRAHILEGGRIIPGRITDMSPRKQRDVARAVKRARFLALLPYTDQH